MHDFVDFNHYWSTKKNRKKPLQKHFQSSMLTRYLQDYLEGKKRMSLIITAKSGEEDCLDTSYLLRQSSPYMQIKYNEVELSNIVSKKRHYQASSIMENTKLYPLSEHLKSMRLVTEHNEQNDEVLKKGRLSWENLRERPHYIVTFKPECDSQVQSERGHIIMQNFAKVIWNVLKQYHSKLKVAEMEIGSLKESIGYEKKNYLELETQLSEFKTSCTCCKGGKIKNDPEDCSSVCLDQPHGWEQEVLPLSVHSGWMETPHFCLLTFVVPRPCISSSSSEMFAGVVFLWLLLTTRPGNKSYQWKLNSIEQELR